MVAKNGGISNTRRITLLALLVAVALIVSLIESAFPSIIPLAPGAKLGLSNVSPLIALIVLGVPDAFCVMLVKCFLGALVSGGLSGLMYSLPAGIASLIVEIILFEFVFGKMSVAGISLVGAVVFNCMQLVMAGVITGVSLAALLPWLMLAGVLAGAFVGLLTYLLIKKLPYSVYGIRKNEGKDVQIQ
ncbi:MAG: Gx transporter family protein [Clostridiales bacterium]|nr:Gx transporter family protein [Clostridiales bacterium]